MADYQIKIENCNSIDCADILIKKGSLNIPENVCSLGNTGSDRRAARTTRLTPGRCAPQGRNCGILRQTRWDGSMKRRTLKWHLLLVLSVLVSCDCMRI